ncbi:LysR family transcriptional regulator [Novosphingobium sp. BL-52-GroH]|uniref:LysR family transcriptional regulator n=1 Tax=Novosphingobium sp. BL-52-GroH TaxID=3349877 RepID=UPI00384E77B9
MSPSPHHLQCVLAVAEVGSFTAAAASLGISQPALSRIVQDVETEIGCKLFDRDTRNLRPTLIGEQILATMRAAVGDYVQALHRVQNQASGRSGLIRIGALPSLATALLAPAVAELRLAAPDVEMQIYDGLSEAVTGLVLRGEVDIALVDRPAPDDTMIFEELIRDQLGLVCRKDDTLAARAVLDWTVFENRPFIAMSQGSSVRTLVDAAFAQAGVTIRPLYEPRFLATVGALVLSEAGVTALPRLAALDFQHPDLLWRPLLNPSMDRPSGVLRRADRQMHPAAALLVASLKQRLAT